MVPRDERDFVALSMTKKNKQASKSMDVYNAHLDNLIMSGDIVEFRRECPSRKLMRLI